MTKIAQKFAKNRKKLLSLEGGSSKTPHGFLGGLAKKPCRSTRGGGGVKNVQNSVHMVYGCPLILMQFNHNINIKKLRMDEYYDSELRIVLNNTGRNPFGKGCSATFGEMWQSRRNLLQLTKNFHRLICNTDRQNWLSSKL